MQRQCEAGSTCRCWRSGSGKVCVALAAMRVAWFALYLRPASVMGLDLSWTQYSDAAELPMSANWREQMRAQLEGLDTTKLSPEQKMQRKALQRRLGMGVGPSGVRPPAALGVLGLGYAADVWAIIFFSIFGVCFLVYIHSMLHSRVRPKMRPRQLAQPCIAAGAQSNLQPPGPAQVSGQELEFALGSILDELGLETLEDLGEEVVPSGKHQGNTFAEVFKDAPYCTWVCKEPRKGWMAHMSTYIRSRRRSAELEMPLESLSCHDGHVNEKSPPCVLSAALKPPSTTMDSKKKATGISRQRKS